MGEQKSKSKWLNTAKFLAAYLVAAWTFLQFLDWILTRYDVSPNWVDLFLWVFIGIVPSVAIYFYHQERINDGVLKLREKILFPLNALLLALTLYFGFGNSDLGATTKEINFTNDDGNLATQLITKEEFRIGLPIFKFESVSKDTTYTWLEEGITELLYQDLLQDKNLSIYTSDSDGTVNRVSESRIFNDYYLDGTFEVIDDVYKVTPKIRNAKNGRVITEKTFEDTNLLNLLDEASIYVRQNIGITELKRDFYIDLNISEFYSNSLEAIKYNIENNHTKAQEIDPEFALSYFDDASRKIRFSLGEEGEKEIIDKAFRNSNKLPLQRQLQIRILRHIAYEEWGVAEKLLKLQLEIDPSDETYNRLLYAVYGETKQIDAYVKHAEDRFNKNKSIDNGTNLVNASMVSGNYKEIIAALKNIEIVQPNNPDLFTFKLRPQLLSGDIKAAKKTQERTKLMHPRWKNFTHLFDSAIAYLSKQKITANTLIKFEGKFRSQSTEQIYEYWVEVDRLIAYISNQELSAPIIVGPNALINGSYMNRSVSYNTFLRDSLGSIYATKNLQHNYSITNTFWYWSHDDTIKKAEKSLASGDYIIAKKLYENAIKTHPNHFFLKLALKHIDYVSSITKENLNKQYNKILGTYGARNFWSDGEKLFYERKGLTKLRLFPISKNRYISLSRYGNQYGFETTENGELASAVYSYNNEQKIWMKLLENNNYLLKNK
jgi:hypothetical protein